MPNILDEYMIKLGAVVDASGMARFNTALHEASAAVDATAVGMAKSFFKAQTEIVAGFVAIGGAAIGLADKVAMADQEYRLFALHMYMSKDAARGLKVAMDALGQPMENLFWDKELHDRTRQLLNDQRNMSAGMDYDAQMRKIRDIRFEFTRMEVEVQYLGMHVVTDFMKALGLGPDTLLKKLREFNDWVTKHLPEISNWVVHNFMPIWRDIKMLIGDVVSVTRDFATLFDNIIGLISGDDTLTGVANFDKFARSVEKVVHWLAMAAHYLLQIEGIIVGIIGGASVGGVIGSIAGGIAGIPAGPAGIAAGIVGGGVTGTAIGATVGGVGGGLFDLSRHLGIGPFHGSAGITTPGMTATDALINAMIGQESGGNPNAVSSRGARGLMQLMPDTARSLGVDMNDPTSNIRGGTMYINQMLKKYGDLPTALGAYNAGPGRMDKFLAGKATLPAETQDYIGKVLGRAGQTGDVNVGGITIHINAPAGSSPHEIARETGKQVQRNLQEFSQQSWAY